MRVHVIFGSTSDKHIYEPLFHELQALSGLTVRLEICSAHREPEQLRTFIKDQPCDLIIAGAGLAAHLPGFIASETATPVIGLPVSGVLKGLDALLSVLQMPRGMPVLTSGINSVHSIVRFVDWYRKRETQPPVVHVVATDAAHELAMSLRSPLESIKWRFVDNHDELDSLPSVLEVWLIDLTDENGRRMLYERFREDDSRSAADNHATIAVPVVLQQEFEGDIRLLGELTRAGGLWVGVNNLTNALLSILKLWPCSLAERTLLWDLKRESKTSAVT